jgi:hypothetical protein
VGRAKKLIKYKVGYFEASEKKKKIIHPFPPPSRGEKQENYAEFFKEKINHPGRRDGTENNPYFFLTVSPLHNILYAS